MNTKRYSAFIGPRRLVSGGFEELLAALHGSHPANPAEALLVFDDESGKQLDFDLRGSLPELLARYAAEKPKTGPGRPRLGVVSGEVSLLPRHWEWLEAQQHNVSATIRRLVDEAIKREPPEARARPLIEATDREMWALAGNLPGCEEASRALYARDFSRFRRLIAAWPGDLAAHLGEMAGRAGLT